MIKRLEVILKLTERCNIACTYCYYFENADKSALTRPSRLTDSSVTNLSHRLKQALDDNFCNSIRIIFHGGEPLLIGKERFRNICEELRKAGNSEKLTFCMQTNAMLVDDGWIELFQEFDVAVGVSVDGPREIHDRFRLDKRGRPTFEKTIAGIKKLVDASHTKKISPPGALIVVQPLTDPAAILKFVVEDLDVITMDFLLPDATWESKGIAPGLGIYLCNLFDAWIESNNDEISIRLLKSTVSLFVGGASFLGGFGPKRSTALTVLGDGEINGDDFLRPCGDAVVSLPMSVATHSLEDAYLSNEMRLDGLGADQIPDGCGGCAFERVCCGGQLTHRFSPVNGFRNRSIYCGDLKMFYEHVCQHLYDNGVSGKRLEHALRNGAVPTEA